MNIHLKNTSEIFLQTAHVQQLTSVEKHLYRYSYNFAKEVRNATDAEAHQAGLDKVNAKRSLAKQIKFRY